MLPVADAGGQHGGEGLAESEGFEPPDLLQSTVFKTAAFDRSANSPVCSGKPAPGNVLHAGACRMRIISERERLDHIPQSVGLMRCRPASTSVDNSREAVNGPVFLTSGPLSGDPRTVHAFTTRHGGVSQGDWASLNCSFSSGDRRVRILENRARILRALGLRALVSLHQVHGNRVLTIDRNWRYDAMPEGDGMVTREIGIALGVLVADCAPVLLSDPGAGVIGAAHAGWKGALDGITDHVIMRMLDLGADADRLVVAIGPAIQQRSYEVALDFVERFTARSPFDCENCFRIAGDRAWFDLPGYLVRRLGHAGIRHIDCLGSDTCAGEGEFFSYRRMCRRGGRHHGRQMGVIGLREA